VPHSHQYTDVQAEAMTADVKLDLSNLATKSKIADVDKRWWK
jgi:hypothetical protein